MESVSTPLHSSSSSLTELFTVYVHNVLPATCVCVLRVVYVRVYMFT